MPLHDLTNRWEWPMLRHLWVAEIARGLRADLPPGCRAVIDFEWVEEFGTRDKELVIRVEREGRALAAVELISPRSKIRPTDRDRQADRYLNHLRAGLGLLLIDIHRHPIGFGFPMMIAAEVGDPASAEPAPAAVSYRVGPRTATGKRQVAGWPRRLAVGEPLPSVPLFVGTDEPVMIDLEGTYSRAAHDSYVEDPAVV